MRVRDAAMSFEPMADPRYRVRRPVRPDPPSLVNLAQICRFAITEERLWRRGPERAYVGPWPVSSAVMSHSRRAASGSLAIAVEAAGRHLAK